MEMSLHRLSRDLDTNLIFLKSNQEGIVYV